MKLSYREKIGLLIFIVAVVIIVFIAWPIKTIKANIKTHESEKEKIQVTYDDTVRLIDQIPIIEGNITRIYEESKGLSEVFTIQRENFEIDQFIQNILNKDKYMQSSKNLVFVEGEFTEENAIDGPVELYYYTPDVVVYPILEAADTNGDMIEKTDKVLYEKLTNALIMESFEEQDVELHTASVDMKFTKEGLLAFQDELKELDKGVRITSVTIDDYKFGLIDELPENIGYSTGKVTFSFYTMQQIQEPVFAD